MSEEAPAINDPDMEQAVTAAKKSLDVGHFELQSAIDDAATAAQETTKRYSKKGSGNNSDELITSFNPLGGDKVHTVINRSEHPWYKDKTEVKIHASKPSELGEDPYHRAGTDYKVALSGQRGAHTHIERRDSKGEVVYTHESKDVQLARRLGMVGAKVSIRQNSERADSLKKAA